MHANRRHILGGLAAMFAAPRLAGCTVRETPKMMSIELPGLTVQAREERSADRLSLSYLATNTGTQTVFLLDGIHDAIGRDLVFPMRKAPWVTISANEAVMSARFLVPRGAFVPSLNYPFPTRLAPRETAQRTFTVALPMVPVTPYEIFRSPPRPEIRTMPAAFELGYFFGKPGTEQTAKTVNTTEGPRRAFQAISEEGQLIARLGPLGDVPVVVNAVRG